MAIYLDPKADLTFKKVFGEHKELMISFLNAMLPLPDNGQVEWIEYLEPELIPDQPLKKDTIVDVRCRDTRGRQFLVESPDVLSGRDGACIAAAPPKHTPSLNTSSAPQATAPRTARSPAPPRRRRGAPSPQGRRSDR